MFGATVLIGSPSATRVSAAAIVKVRCNRPNGKRVETISGPQQVQFCRYPADYPLALPADLPPGRYTLRVSLWPAGWGEGESLEALLGEVELRAP